MTDSPKIKNILEALDLSALDPEDQEDLLVDLNELIFKTTLVAMIEVMDEKTQTAFEKLLDSDASDEEIDAFIEKNVPNADKIVKDTVNDLASDILLETNKI